MSLVAPTRTLVLGAGGREHALVWRLATEPGGNEVVAAPGSDAIAAEPRTRRLADGDPPHPPQQPERGAVALCLRDERAGGHRRLRG